MILSGSASASIFAERSRSLRPNVAWKLRDLPRSSTPLGLSLPKRSSYKTANPPPTDHQLPPPHTPCPSPFSWMQQSDGDKLLHPHLPHKFMGCTGATWHCTTTWQCLPSSPAHLPAPQTTPVLGLAAAVSSIRTVFVRSDHMAVFRASRRTRFTDTPPRNSVWKWSSP